jgi:hypothetical protein
MANTIDYTQFYSVRAQSGDKNIPVFTSFTTRGESV